MLIIFDCDGVLVDSEALAARVFSQQLQQYSIPLTAADCERRFRGHTLPHCLAVLQNEFSTSLPADFLSLLSLATQDAFAAQLQAVKDVETVLKWLQRGSHQYCVASNGSLSKIEHSLRVTNLLRYFAEHRFSAEQVKVGKPAPDLFLHAAHQMGFSVEEVVVIEDSEAGVTAALAAGMRVCRFCAEATSGDDRVYPFAAMADLPRLLQRLSAEPV